MTNRTNNTSRRIFLAGSAAITAAAVTGSAVALQPDPIFAAIEAHKAARVTVYSAVDAVIAMETQLASEGIAPRDQKGERRLEEVEAALHVAFEAETAAACVLVSGRPTTIPGVLALLQYANAADTDGQGWPDCLYADDTRTKSRSWHYFLIEAVAEALPGMVQA